MGKPTVVMVELEPDDVAYVEAEQREQGIADLGGAVTYLLRVLKLIREQERGPRNGRFLSPREAGEAIGYGEDKARDMCERGVLHGAYRDGPGGHWRIPEDTVEAWKQDIMPRKRVRGAS